MFGRYSTAICMCLLVGVGCTRPSVPTSTLYVNLSSAYAGCPSTSYDPFVNSSLLACQFPNPITPCNGSNDGTLASILQSGCGTAGVTCAPGSICNKGQCMACPAGSYTAPGCDTCISCGPGQTTCNNSCVTEQTYRSDDNNCGACGNKCPAGIACVDATCSGVVCEVPNITCGDPPVCTDTRTSENHCANCNSQCPAGTICSDSACVCSDGRAQCNGSTCCGSNQICQGGACVSACNGQAVDTNTDNNNCGGCGNICSSGKTCQGGTCACPAGQTFCGGNCVESSVHDQFCGASCADCPSGYNCINSSCQLNCPASQTLCGGVCVDKSQSEDNCGACGNVCTGGRSCQNGSCQCPGGTAFCGGTCINITSDVNNCGGCGNVCSDDDCGFDCVRAYCSNGCQCATIPNCD